MSVPVLFGLPALDRTLPDGLPPGSCVVLTGPPGAGKSMLLRRVAHRALAGGLTVLYADLDEQLGANALGLLRHQLGLTPGQAEDQVLDEDSEAVSVLRSWRTRLKLTADVNEFLDELAGGRYRVAILDGAARDAYDTVAVPRPEGSAQATLLISFPVRPPLRGPGARRRDAVSGVPASVLGDCDMALNLERKGLGVRIMTAKSRWAKTMPACYAMIDETATLAAVSV
jgi:hypothetical protein